MNSKKTTVSVEDLFFSKSAGLLGAGVFGTFGQGLEAAVERTPSASNPSDLKITDLKCGYVRGALYVKIYTNQEVWGCGEAVDAIQGTYYLVKRMGDQIKGQNPLNPNRIAEQLRKGAFFRWSAKRRICRGPDSN